MKLIKCMLFTGLFLLMSAQTAFAAKPITKKAAEEIAARYIPAQCELLESEQENNSYIFRFYNKNSQEWYKITLEKEEGSMLTFDSCKTLNKGGSNVVVTPEEAQSVVRVEFSEAEIVSSNLVESNGVYKYEVEFTSEELHGEYTIHPESGTVLEREIFIGALPLAVSGTELESAENETAASAVYIGTEKAKKAALSKVPGAEVVSCDLIYEDGRAVYKGSLKKGYFNYAFMVDAITGTMVKWDMETLNQQN